MWRPRIASAAVLLLHGAFDYAAAFDEIGPKLAQQGFAALAFDQRGFGATASRGRWAGAERMAQDAAEAAEFLINRTHAPLPLFILGESMGAAVAIHTAIAARTPQLRGLVLAAPGALASGFRRHLLSWLAAVLRRVGGDTELLFERVSGWELTPAAAIRLMSDPLVMRRIRPEILCGLSELALSAVEQAAHVAVSVLTITGARDELVRTGCIQRLFDNLPGEKSWLVMADAPHLLLHWRQNREVLREAARWMAARVTSAAGGAPHGGGFPEPAPFFGEPARNSVQIALSNSPSIRDQS
jgi:alpha-beta hydrolase superfamily lysophospholipase